MTKHAGGAGGTRALLGSLALLMGLAAGALAAGASTPQTVIKDWPKLARATASAMLEKYGRPDQFDHDSIVWFNNGSWKRTVVYRKALRHVARTPDRDYLQQTIAYPVPEAKVALLKRFSPMLDVVPSAGEISFCSDSEKRNFLAMNLIDEVATGKRTGDDARNLYSKWSRLSAAGKSTPYMEGLVFDVDNTRVMTPTGADQ